MALVNLTEAELETLIVAMGAHKNNLRNDLDYAADERAEEEVRKQIRAADALTAKLRSA